MQHTQPRRETQNSAQYKAAIDVDIVCIVVLTTGYWHCSVQTGVQFRAGVFSLYVGVRSEDAPRGWSVLAVSCRQPDASELFEWVETRCCFWNVPFVHICYLNVVMHVASSVTMLNEFYRAENIKHLILVRVFWPGYNIIVYCQIWSDLLFTVSCLMHFCRTATVYSVDLKYW